MFRLLFIVLLLQAAPASVSFHGIAMDVPPELRFTRDGEQIHFECRAENCEEEPITLSRHAASEFACSRLWDIDRADSLRGQPRALPPVEAGGLTVEVVSRDRGCRNLVAPQVSACLVRGDETYVFVAGPHTCQTGPGDHGALFQMLRSVRSVPAVKAP